MQALIIPGLKFTANDKIVTEMFVLSGNLTREQMARKSRKSFCICERAARNEKLIFSINVLLILRVTRCVFFLAQAAGESQKGKDKKYGSSVSFNSQHSLSALFAGMHVYTLFILFTLLRYETSRG